MSDNDEQAYEHFFPSATELVRAVAAWSGISTDDPNLEDTPRRYCRAMADILGGAQDTDNKINEILATGFPAEGFDEMLIVNKIQASSLCPHHLLPVYYEIAIGYIPGDNGIVLGLSKIPRLAKALSGRPVLQEALTRQIADVLMERVGAIGAAVLIRGKHSCMWARGVREFSSWVTTSAMLGVFREKAEARAEFLSIVGSGRGR